MHVLLNILAQAPAVPAEPIEAVAHTLWDPASIILCTTGMCLLIGWLFWFGGFGALRQGPVRRHRRRFLYWPPAILAIWILTMVGIQTVVSVFFDAFPAAQRTIISYFANIVLEIALIVLMLLIAESLFARGLRGLGLKRVPIPTDAAMATVNLLAVFPLVFGGLALTLAAGRLLSGPDFDLQVHQSLEILSDAGPGLKIMIFTFAVLIVPVFEELLFRGFLQTSLRSVSGRPWTAIVMTSLFFAILHPATHIAALFMLSCGLGYAYERSGSLTRPILMHVLFNGLNVAVTLLLPS
jgi:membrane protease YdiL (CAAX protease family)